MKKSERWCKHCECLGVTDTSNLYVSCDECAKWKDELQEKPNDVS